MKFTNVRELLENAETQNTMEIEIPIRKIKLNQTFIADTTNSLMLVSICNFFIIASCRACGSDIILTDTLGFEHVFTDNQCDELPVIILGKIID